MSEPYRQSASPAREPIERSAGAMRARRRQRLVTFAIAFVTLGALSLVLGAEPGFGGCSGGGAVVQGR